MSATEVPPNFIVILATSLIPEWGRICPWFTLAFAAAYIEGVAPRLNPKESGALPSKIGMESKTFSGAGPDAIIKAVNDWLAGETGVSIRNTETRHEPADPVTGSPRMTFQVWYDRSDK